MGIGRSSTAAVAAFSVILMGFTPSPDDISTGEIHQEVPPDSTPPQFLSTPNGEVAVAGPYQPDAAFLSAVSQWDADLVDEVAILVKRFVLDAYPSAHAGVWISETNDGPAIHVGFTDAMDSVGAEESIRDAVPGTYPLELVSRSVTEDQLDDAADTLIAAHVDVSKSDDTRSRSGLSQVLTQAIDTRALAVEVDLVSGGLTVFTGDPVGKAGDVPHERITQAEHGEDALQAARIREREAASVLEDQLDVPIVVHENAAPVPEVTCNNRGDCRPNLLGGLGIRPDDRFGLALCSTGFTAVGGSGRKFALTAGHCVDAGRDWRHGVRTIGRLEQPTFSGHTDSARIVRADVDYWTMRGEVVIETGDPARDILSVMSRQAVIDGSASNQYGISAGRTARTMRGVRASTNASVSYDGNTITRVLSLRQGAVGDICTQDGDSGSTWFRNNSAVAIHHGSNRARGVPCADPAYRTYGTFVEYALPALNVSLIYG